MRVHIKALLRRGLAAVAVAAAVVVTAPVVGPTFGLTTSVALAQVPPRAPRRPAPPAADRVAVQLMVVHATNAHSRVDARLEGLLAHLRHFSYTGYDVLETRTETLTAHQEATFPVAGGRTVKVQLVDHDATNARLRVRMFKNDSKVLDSTVSVRRNRSFIVMGPGYEGGVLMLPITARY